TYLSSIFFFHRYRAYPHLHSFPTRRSSDLSKFRKTTMVVAFAMPCFSASSATEAAYESLREKPLTSSTTGIGLSFTTTSGAFRRSEEHTSELQSRGHLVCRLLLEKKKQNTQ